MEFFRDWSFLENTYEKPDGGPSDARVAGNTILNICKNHIYPYTISGEIDRHTLAPQNVLFDVCSKAVTIKKNENPEGINGNDRCVELFEEDQEPIQFSSQPVIIEPS
ncbi:hypothetical protein TRFO_23412 [Tritrichomonas foetus]|uniref:Uncharacterized protein n=1 Tax=Tritrichomonas foetus TaxID=1144522 RepID=A0A1J4K9J1_9EUKA|nr:hypothetical protein TRFO_23412 [Tritrichomonas foetus]|eukprot:OHT08137.1 hypothetical protein TRFO_23412 [Tritrichomonas foetus]